jgi:hypothetical protein
VLVIGRGLALEEALLDEPAQQLLVVLLSHRDTPSNSRVRRVR